MRFKLALLAFMCLTVNAFSQSKNNIFIVFTPLSNDVDTHGAISDSGFDGKTGILFGFDYTYSFTKHFSVETGLLYTENKTRLTYITPGFGTGYSNGNAKMLTVPLLAKVSFLKYLFVNGGLLIDAEPDHLSNSPLNNQSGIGYSIGLGGEYNSGHIAVFLNPFTAYHSLIPFTGKQAGENLLDAGVKLGVGYNF